LTIRKFEGIEPEVAESAYIDKSALLIGEVRIDERAGVYPGAVLRADESQIEIGRGSFILDLALIEAPSGFPVTIGEGTIISHGAMIHGCTVGDSCLIGIGAIILERAIIGDRCIVAAGSLVPPGMKVKSGSVLMGSPAKIARDIKDDDISKLRSEINHLKTKAQRYRESEL